MKIKEDLTKWKDIPCSGIEKLNIVTTSAPPPQPHPPPPNLFTDVAPKPHTYMKTNSKWVIVLYAKQKTIKLPSLQWNDGLE